MLFLPVAAAQNAVERESNPPVFKGLLQKYRNFRDIKPTLENPGDRSVFLSSFYPQAAAQHYRYNDQMKRWEAGKWTRYCASQSGVGKPIELKPGERFQPHRITAYPAQAYRAAPSKEATEEEALENILDAIKEYLAAVETMGGIVRDAGLTPE